MSNQNIDKVLRILEVNKAYYPHIGGIESLIKQYSEELSEFPNTTVQVLACRDNRGKGSVEIIDGINVTRCASWGTYFSCPISFSFIKNFRKMAKNADVVEIHVPFPLADLALMLSGYKGKVVVAWHSDVVKQKKLLALYKPLMKYLMKRADKIIVATEGHIKGSDYLQDYKDKCVVIPYGLTLSEYEMTGHSPVLTDKLNKSSNKKVLFSGRLVPYKGIDVLINAFKNVEGAELFISGEGPLEEQLKAQAAGMEDKIHFLGFLSDEDHKAAYADCDMFVLPSVLKSEAFGIVQMEAMAFGKPVINTNLPSGVPYVSVAGKTGLTVEPYDVNGLCEAINKLVGDDALRAQYGKAARLRVEECFNEQDVIKKLYNLLSE